MQMNDKPTFDGRRRPGQGFRAKGFVRRERIAFGGVFAEAPAGAFPGFSSIFGLLLRYSSQVRSYSFNATMR